MSISISPTQLPYLFKSQSPSIIIRFPGRKKKQVISIVPLLQRIFPFYKAIITNIILKKNLLKTLLHHPRLRHAFTHALTYIASRGDGLTLGFFLVGLFNLLGLFVSSSVF